MELLTQILLVAGLVLGFGFVVFWHELGHFLAAKWVGIKVEQFAVGFGHAMFAWRKGLGIRVGTTTPEYDKRVGAYLAQNQKDPALSQARNETERHVLAAKALGLSETEYRLNWIPLGGYVKMLGQDDMNPNATAEDPRAYNRKSIGARMFVVSAGVIMNVILAILMFIGLYLYGHNIWPPVVGGMLSNSPAQKAGLQVGDRIREFNEAQQSSFMSLQLEVALAHAGKIPVKIERGGKTLDLFIEPERPDDNPKSFFAMGITQMPELRGLDPRQVDKNAIKELDRAHEIIPGDVVTAVNGHPVSMASQAEVESAYALFDHELQESGGKPVELTVNNPAEGGKRTVSVIPVFQPFFGEKSFSIAGLSPAPMVSGFTAELMKGKLKEGDVITGVWIGNEQIKNLDQQHLIERIISAGEHKVRIDFMVERGGQKIDRVEGAVPSVKLDIPKGARGVGIALSASNQRPLVVAVDEKSAMKAIPAGAVITQVNGQAVANWPQVVGALRKAGNSATITFQEAGKPQPTSTQVHMADSDVESLRNLRYTHLLVLAEHLVPRKTHNPLIAAKWGLMETRDLLRQFYVTLLRLTQGRVSATNFMGPLGIAKTGWLFAGRGVDWLIWFLAMISANLAVVNFLPIPIVDGGLFLFLILEKVQGRPLSPRTQAIAQYVGLAIIVSVFLMVTYQDILRW